MGMKTLTPEQVMCFNAAIELASAAVASKAISSDAQAVKDYVNKMYPALKEVVRTLTF